MRLVPEEAENVVTVSLKKCKDGVDVVYSNSNFTQIVMTLMNNGSFCRAILAPEAASELGIKYTAKCCISETEVED